MVGPVEYAILISYLNINQTNDGQVIRLNFPSLTEERRKEMSKSVHKKAEDHKVAIRNIRRDANDEVQKLKKGGKLSEDEAKRLVDQVQKLTDHYIEMVEKLRVAKDQELMEV
jgi:ribosome recycling factor